jgi:general secretion pathway protein D
MRKLLWAMFLVVSSLSVVASDDLVSDPAVNINFNNLKIEDFITMVAKITRKNILIDKDIKGTIDFVSVEPIKRSQLYDLLLNILDTKGYSIRDTKRGFLKIIKNADAPRSAPPLLSNKNISEVQTAIISVKNVSVKNVLRQVNFLLSKYGKIGLSYDSNSVIVTDFPANIKSINMVLSSLDRHKDTTVKFIRLNRATAKNVYPKIKKIASSLFDAKIKSQKVEISYDDATNSIIMIGNEDNIYKLVPKIKFMDHSDDTVEKKMEIIHLANADCTDIVKILQKLLTDKSFGKGSETKTKSSIKGKKTTTSSVTSMSDQNKPTITVDTELNAIIVFATKSELRDIKQIIKQLDIERQQVYVVAKIFEISRNKARELGVKYGLGGGMVKSDGIFGLSATLGGSIAPVETFISSLDLSKSDMPNLSKALSLGAALSLYKNNGVANVISEPTLLCVNNKESSLYAGKTESILTTSSTGTSTTDTTRNNYTREDIGLTLKVKPRISSDDKVVLDIKATLEDVVDNTNVGLPTTTKRDVKTLSIVQNGETVIIGGLVKSKDAKKSIKIPLLGDIPILGIPFRHKYNSDEREDLVIMITPYIVNKSSDLQRVRKNLDKIDAFSNEMALKLQEERGLQQDIYESPKSNRYNPTPTHLKSEEF